MAVFKFVVGYKGKSYQIEKDQKDSPIIGKRIGDKLDGSFIGLDGYELEITGGSDKEGFPMRKDIEGIGRKRIVMTPGIGYKAEYGVRRRRSMRGNSVTIEISQINCKVLKEGSKPLEELMPKKEASEEKKQ